MHAWTTDAVVVIENEKGRDALLARAESALARGECLVRIVDVIGMRRTVTTTPRSAHAQLVAREVPVVLRGGLTSLVTYWRVPVGELDAREAHTLLGEVSHTYETTLQVARVGTRAVAASDRAVVA